MLLHVDARLYHALGLRYNNAAGICGNLYFTWEREERWKTDETRAEKYGKKIAQVMAADCGPPSAFT